MKAIKVFMGKDNLTIISKFMLWFAIIYIVVVSASFSYVLNEWDAYTENVVTILEQKDDKSPSETCNFIECKRIVFNDNSIVYRNGDGEFSSEEEVKDGMFSELSSVLTMDIVGKYSGYTYVVTYIDVLIVYLDIILTLYFLILVAVLVFLYRFIVSSSIETMVNGASRTAALHNKNMSMLAEQLHHEINTPLTVVKTLCDKIFDEMKAASVCEIGKDSKKEGPCESCRVPKRYMTLRGYKKMIDNNIKQAYVVIERMAEVKQVRYSNGNKSIYDISKATFDIMGVYNRANYKYTIDDDLRRFVVDHRTGIKNHELMNILLNHIKNSLEAEASEISIVKYSIRPYIPSFHDKVVMQAVLYVDKYIARPIASLIVVAMEKFLSKDGKSHTSKLEILLVDNGNGVPESAKTNIFNLNWSSKSKEGIVRGAGLYLNRAILRTAGGDVKLIESSDQGTTFMLTIPIVEK